MVALLVIVAATHVCSAQQAEFVCGTRPVPEAQPATTVGPFISVTGLFHAAVVFVQFADDREAVDGGCGPDDWPVRATPSSPPTYPTEAADFLDSGPSGPFGPRSLTSYFREISSNAFTLYGEEFAYKTRRNARDYLANPDGPTPRIVRYGDISREVLAFLDSTYNGDLRRFDADRNGQFDHLFIVIRNIGFGNGISCSGDRCASAISDLGIYQSTPITYGRVTISNEYSGSFNIFDTISPLDGTLKILAHEIGHDIWGPHLEPFYGNNVPLLPPFGRTDPGDGYVGHALMVSSAGTSGRVDRNENTSAAERAFVSRSITDPTKPRWISCPALADGQVYSVGDVGRTGNCFTLPLGTVGGKVREMYFSNVQRDTPFSQLRTPQTGISNDCPDCNRIEAGFPTTGLLVEYVERETAPGGMWSRDVVPADDRLSGFQRCDIIDSPDPANLTIEQVFGGDLWRPGVDRQLTPWTRPNVYGYHDLSALPAGTLAAGLYAVDDIRRGAGSNVDFTFYRTFTNQATAYVRKDWWVTNQTNGLATFSNLTVEEDATLTVESGAILVVNGTLLVAKGGMIAVGGEIRFGPSGRLVVEGSMNGAGGSLAAQNPTRGWGGVRFAGAGTAVWTGFTVRDVVTSETSKLVAAVTVYGRELLATGSVVSGTRDDGLADRESGGGYYVAGVGGSLVLSGG